MGPKTLEKTAGWTREQVQHMLRTSDRAVERALVVLYDRQTPTEQAAGHTSKLNGVGFGANDAEIFTSFAKSVIRGRRLTPKQLAVCRGGKGEAGRIGRYWRQLLEEIVAKNQTHLPGSQKGDHYA